jgi:ABC-type spermidine/putrescine transport system permease subunit II
MFLATLIAVHQAIAVHRANKTKCGNVLRKLNSLALWNFAIVYCIKINITYTTLYIGTGLALRI